MADLLQYNSDMYNTSQSMAQVRLPGSGCDLAVELQLQQHFGKKGPWAILLLHWLARGLFLLWGPSQIALNYTHYHISLGTIFSLPWGVHSTRHTSPNMSLLTQWTHSLLSSCTLACTYSSEWPSTVCINSALRLSLKIWFFGEWQRAAP